MTRTHARPRLPVAVAAALAAVFLAGQATAAEARRPVRKATMTFEAIPKDQPKPDGFRILADGELVAEYRQGGLAKPVLFPLVGPRGERLSRAWPLEDGVAGEAHDHPHHESLWFTHGAVNGIDFWAKAKGSWPPPAGAEPIPHVIARELGAASGGDHPVTVNSVNDWCAPDGTVVCSDERDYVFTADETSRSIEITVTLRADHGPVTLGDTKEGTMAIRVATALQPKDANGSQGAAGRVVNSEGLENAAAWGKRARWVDYSGSIDGHLVGIAMFDHPTNLRHPTWWHARDYGLFAANPFGAHDFAGAEKGSGDHTIPAGESLTFRYLVILHDGDAAAAGIDARYRRWIGAE